MNTHQSLYELTGNIGDYNTILINRGELHQLIESQQEMINQLKIAEQFMNIASDWNLDEVHIDGEWCETHQLVENIRNVICSIAAKGESK